MKKILLLAIVSISLYGNSYRNNMCSSYLESFIGVQVKIIESIRFGKKDISGLKDKLTTLYLDSTEYCPDSVNTVTKKALLETIE